MNQIPRSSGFPFTPERSPPRGVSTLPPAPGNYENEPRPEPNSPAREHRVLCGTNLRVYISIFSATKPTLAASYTLSIFASPLLRRAQCCRLVGPNVDFSHASTCNNKLEPPISSAHLNALVLCHAVWCPPFRVSSSPIHMPAHPVPPCPP